MFLKEYNSLRDPKKSRQKSKTAPWSAQVKNMKIKNIILLWEMRFDRWKYRYQVYFQILWWVWFVTKLRSRTALLQPESCGTSESCTLSNRVRKRIESAVLDHCRHPQFCYEPEYINYDNLMIRTPSCNERRCQILGAESTRPDPPQRFPGELWGTFWRFQRSEYHEFKKAWYYQNRTLDVNFIFSMNFH